MDGERPQAGEAGHDGDSSRLCARLLVLSGVLLATLLGFSAPASALTQQGHSFAFSFGVPGHSSGQLDEPSGIAVNESTGTVYVADRLNNRIQEFESSGGKFVPGKSIEVPYPTSIAVDNSTESSDPSKGDIYVVGATAAEAKELQLEGTTPEEFLVYKYSEKGSLIKKIKKIKGKEVFEEGEKKETETFEEELEVVRGVAVDSHGSLFVDDEEAIFEFNNASKNKAIAHFESEGGETTEGLAVDSQDNLYAGVESPEEASELEEQLTAQNKQEDRAAGLLSAGVFEFGVVSELKLSRETASVEVPEFDPEFSPAVAVNTAASAVNGVDERGDVYITNVASSAGKPISTVAVFNAHHELIQHIAVPKEGTEGQFGDGIAVDAKTGVVFASIAKADTVDVFEREKEGPPTIVGLTACTLGGGPGCPGGAGVAKLSAQLDPHGVATKYRFEYGAAVCAAEPSPCTSTTEATSGKGFEDEVVSAELEGLAAGTYHYRIVAKSPAGEASEEHTFTIMSAASGALPDSREYELVSPAQKEGNEPEPIASAGSTLRAAEDGHAITYAADGPMGGCTEGNRNPEYDQLLSSRGGLGWSTCNITTPNDTGTGIAPSKVPEYADFTANLALALVEPYPSYARGGSVFAEPPLAPPVSRHEGELANAGQEYLENTMYLRADPPQQPQASETANYQQAVEHGRARAQETGSPQAAGGGGYISLVNELNAPGYEPFGGGAEAGENKGIEFTQVATPDLSYGVLVSRRAATGAYEWGPQGQIQLISEVPEAPAVSCSDSGALEVSVEKATGGTVQYKFTDNTRTSSVKYETAAIGYDATAAEVAKAFEEATATNPSGETLALPAGSLVASAGPLDTSAVVLTVHNPAVGSFSALTAVETALEGPNEPGNKKSAGLRYTGCKALGADEVSVGGANQGTQRNAISQDGSRIILTVGNAAGGGQTQHLYVRDTATEATLQLDVPAAGAGAGPLDPMFQTASVDGSKVFFTDTQRLTSNSKATELTPDLYVAELSGGEGEGEPLVSKLIDLTPEGNGGESADVPAYEQYKWSGGVMGASEDGSYIYFAASGALAPGATRGACYAEQEPTASCNLYVRHHGESGWEPTRLIATVSAEDGPDWGDDKTAPVHTGGDLSFMASRVSPNGAYLAFMSYRSLTGYDNEDRTGHEPDEEVYLYSAGKGDVVCASCNPAGEQPAGVLDLQSSEGGVQEGAEGVGLVADRTGVWNKHWLGASLPGWTTLNLYKSTYQSRYLSNEGRLFFDSPDTLVPAVKEEVEEGNTSKEKVYQYEPGGLGSCASAAGCISLISSAGAKHEATFLDASANGNDVFFLSAEKLTQQDIDQSFDIYDAHACEAASPCLPPPAGAQPVCRSAEECRPGGYSSSSYEAPASSAEGPGNPAPKTQESLGEKTVTTPLTPAQLLAKALSVCKKDKNHSKRAACEKSARAKYYPKLLAAALKACKKDKGSKRKTCETTARRHFTIQKAKKASHAAAARKGR